jgi:uncharacterized protein
MPRWQSRILTLGDETVLVECGPMRMFIDGSLHGVRRPELCREAAIRSIGFLEEIAADRALLHGPAVSLPPPSPGGRSWVMWSAARLVGDRDLTPMAAVAGTIADATAEYLEHEGLTRVIVNNGGDLAIRLYAGESAAVGIRSDVNNPKVLHRVVLLETMGVRGVCTSGLGGRSFTRGVASAATIFAPCAALADAAATSVANATYVSSPAVSRVLADSVDPETDLRGVEVTGHVGELSERETEAALTQGIERAEELVRLGLIWGACVFVQGRLRSTAGISAYLEPLRSAPGSSSV